MNEPNPEAEFKALNTQGVRDLSHATEMHRLTKEWLNEAVSLRYTYLFTALGRPVIQFPQDVIEIQELVWQIRPDLIIETGIAHGGSLVNNASMLALLDLCDAIESGDNIDPRVSRRRTLGIDIDIRPHNRAAIEAHPMSSRITMIEGSSTDQEVIAQVSQISANHEKVMVLLDSNHTHDHVLQELRAYAPLTSVGSYCIVYDTVIEDMPRGSFPDRPWDVGNNPKTAVWEYLKEHPEFTIDRLITDKLQITVAPDGYLKRNS